MNGSVLQLVLASVVAGGAGAALAYLVAVFMGKRHLRALSQQHDKVLGNLTAERDGFAQRSKEMHAKVQSLQSQNANYRSELEAMLSEKTTESNQNRRRLKQMDEQHQAALDEITARNTDLSERSSQMHAKIDELESDATSHRAELKAVQKERDALAAQNEALTGNIKAMTDKSKGLIEGIEALKAERELTKSKVNEMQNMLVAVHQRMLALQGEFEKAGEFYKRELTKSFKRRQQLEEEIKSARAEQEAFRKRIEASIEEHGSAEEMILNAEARLGQIGVLERNVNRLEAEKAELLEDVKQLRFENDRLQKEVAEVVELRIHNEQLVMAVEGLEQSRREQEAEANKARNKAKESEAMSDTLRMRLSDLEKGFAEMEKEQNNAIKHVREVAASTRPAGNRDVEYPEKYDLIA